MSAERIDSASPTSSSTRDGHVWRAILGSLEPRVGKWAPDQLRQARLCSGLALSNSLNSAFAAWMTGSSIDTTVAQVGPPVLAGAAVVSLLAYLLTRAGRLHTAAIVLVATSLATFVAIQIPTLPDMRAQELPGVWSALMLVAASALLSSGWTVVLTVVAVVLDLAMRPFAPPEAAEALGFSAMFVGFLGTFLAVLASHRNRIEADRAEVLRTRNAELEALRATLEEKVEARTAELEAANQSLRRNQQSLVLTEKMASLGRLTAGIAHEMNSPIGAVRAALCSIRGLIDEYKASIGDPEVNDDDHRAIADELTNVVALAETGAERAHGFVRSMKAQTRDESMDEIEFDVVQCTRDALRLLQHAAVDANVRVELDAPSTTLGLTGRPGRFQQVITNLVQNAIDASSGTREPVRVSLGAEDRRLKIVVADGGEGIAPEVRPRIFDPLFTTKPTGQGTGLGLTIVHDIVRGELEGEIDITSEPGHGTEFTLHIPMAKGA